MASPETKRQLLWTSSVGAGVLLVAALVGFVNYFGFKYYQRFDWTRDEIYSLSEKSLGVLDALDRDVEVVVFMRPESELYGPTRELLARYAARSPRVKVRTVDPEKNLVEAQQLVDRYQVRSLNVVVFDRGDDRRVVEEADLADYDYTALQFGGAPEMTGFQGEERFTGALLELAEARKPTILFTAGHGEASLDDFSTRGLSSAQELLGKENLEMRPWPTLGAAEVPEGTDLVVVAGPTSAFVAPELAMLSRYLERGGRILLLLDPALGEGGLVDTGLGPWLAGYGVEVGADIVVDPANPLPFFGAETIFVQATGEHPIVRPLAQARVPVILPLARSVAPGEAPAGVEVTVLLETSAEGWGERDLANLGAVARDASDLAGPVPLAVAAAAERGGRGAGGIEEEELEGEPGGQGAAGPAPNPGWRLVVFGDADFATNAQLASAGNPTLLANTMNWLVERPQLLGIGPKRPEQVRLSLTASQIRWVSFWVLLGLPGLAVAAGVWMHFRRRR
ncbi:MAG: Gldg family protein [Thermoanaerobaculia bacterium]|nr:Gldg family protein [Thermoanaerobaculia bacterium]